MACSLSSFCSSNQTFCRQKLSQYPKIRFQSFRDNGKRHYYSISTKEVNTAYALEDDLTLMKCLNFLGKPANIVDANLSVLRERIQQVRKRERLEHTCGWNYKQNYDPKHKRDSMVSESAEIMGLACGAIGLVFLIDSVSICLVSLLV